MEKLSYKLEVFEGPLDVLLTLISKNKLNIYDIKISELLEQYMNQISLMRVQNLDVTADFLEMAARLVYIKSLSLLPKHEEEEALRQELVGQLIEYQQCKEVAAKLAEMVSFDKFVRQISDIPQDMEYKRSHKSSEMLSAIISAMGKGKSLLPPKSESFSAIVSHRIVSVTSQAISLLRRLMRDKIVTYFSFFVTKKDKSERVAAFLALLELVKGGRVRIDGDGDKSKIKLMRGGGGH